MSVTKKIAACLTAAAMALTLASCGKNTTWSAVIDDEEIKSGIFLIFQMDAYYEAYDYIPVTELEDGEYTPPPDVLDITIEDKPAREWINNRAMEMVREFVAVEHKFNELGLVISELEAERAKINVEQMWAHAASTNEDSYGVKYEKSGISKQSQIDVFLNQSKLKAVFNYYYGRDGINAITDDEVNQYITEYSAMIKFIEMPLKDGEGNLLKSDGKAEMLSMANDYIERAKAGESFDDLIDEFDAYKHKLWVDAMKAEIEAAGDEWDEEWFARDDHCDHANDEFLHSSILSKEGSFPAQEVVDKVFSGSISIGDIVLIELDEVYYVVLMQDILSRTEYIEQIDEAVRQLLKGEEFSDIIKSWTLAQNVQLNDAAISKFKIERMQKYLG